MKGTYALICILEEACDIPMGRRGTLSFEQGTYVYVGSAMSGVRQRVRRHLSREKRHHWHIDWFLDAARVDDVGVCKGDKSQECATACALSQRGSTIKGFGSSDCRCDGHLILIREDEARTVLAQCGYSFINTV